MSHIDPPESAGLTAGTSLIALIAAAAMTFCTPAPAVQQTGAGRCYTVLSTFVAIADDVTSEAEARARFEALDVEDKRWLATAVLPVWQSSPDTLEETVPKVFAACMKRGVV